MRVLRAKAVRKNLRFFKLIFGIKAPYHIILDGNFIFAALKNKFDIKHRLESLLQDEVRLFIFRSSLDELVAVGEKARAAADFARSCCEIVSGGAEISTSDPRTPIVQYLDNLAKNGKKTYFVATQDDVLREQLRRVPGIPLVFFNKVTLVLENPSSTSLNFTAEVERRKLEVTRLEAEQLSGLKRKRDDTDTTAASTAVTPTEPVADKRPKPTFAAPPKKKRASAPNPLSNRLAQANSRNNEKKKRSKFRNA